MSSTASGHPDPSPPLRLHVIVACVAFAVTLMLLAHGGVSPTHTGVRHLDPLAVTLAACGTLPLIAARHYPLGVFVVATSAHLLLAGLDYPADLLIGPTVALYLLAASRRPQQPWTGAATLTVLALFILYLAVTAAAHRTFPASELVHTGLAWAGAWFAGERTRLRREQLLALNERASRAERDVERERLLATAEERARIARDLHDSVGHTISVIGVRAGAARLRHMQEPDRSLLALQAIEEIARHTVEEIDHIVTTLRADKPADADLGVPPRLASLDTLISHHVAAGCSVAVDLAGPPRPLAAATDQAAYRILQEALTNAARHGADGVHVRLAYGTTAIELTVTNPLPADPPRRSEGGHGLIGMRERAALLGGRLDTACVDGTFRIHAEIPYGQRT